MDLRGLTTGGGFGELSRAASRSTTGRRPLGFADKRTAAPGRVGKTSDMAVDEEDVRFAHQLADEAARVTMRWFKRVLSVELKSDGTPVTNADTEVEEAIRAAIRNERPEDDVIGEEGDGGEEKGRSRRRWIVDPIDGTRSFIEGSPAWGSLIALEVDGELEIGVADQPACSRRTWAARGLGAFRDAGSGPVQLQVSDRQSVRGARTLPLPEDIPVDLVPEVRALWSELQPLPPPASPDDLDHPGLLVATGKCDIALTFGGPWDIAAVAVIVREAGGRFTDLSGTSNVNAGSALFTNGLVHDALLGGIT